MQSVILAGGKGTRLRPLTVYTPKPIVPVVNRPFLLYQLENLKRAGISDAVLALSYLPDKIEQVLDGATSGIELRFTTESQPLGTAGAFGFAIGNSDETCVVLNGDILTDLDLAKVIAEHEANEADATIVLTPVENPSAYGLVEIASDKRVTKFREKPQVTDLPLTNNTINAGIYVLSGAIRKLIPEGENSSFEYDIFPRLLAEGKRVFAFVMKNDYWIDIGTPQRYLQAHHDFLSGKIKHFPLNRSADYDSATTASIDASSVIGENCVIKPGTRVLNSVIGKGVHIGEKATIENSVIWSHTHISGGAIISNAVIGRSCQIGKNVTVESGAVLGDKSSLTDYTKV